MIKFDLILDLLNEVASFEKSRAGVAATVEDFRHYLNQKAYEKQVPEKLKVVENEVIENEITEQVILLGRFTRQLLKKVFSGNENLVNEDFTYLFRLMDYPSLTKMQLIEKNVHEKQTGIEIIRRLVKNGLLAEHPDEQDRRSTRISVTEKGKAIFLETMEAVTVVSKIMCGKLSLPEKENLLESLKKLNIFHHTVYSNYRNAGLPEILKMMNYAE